MGAWDEDVEVMSLLRHELLGLGRATLNDGHLRGG